MGIDSKYGRVTTERGKIGEDEPVVVFRAQDALLPSMLADYHLMCAKAGSPKHHLELILETRNTVVEWQRENPTQTPRSDSLKS